MERTFPLLADGIDDEPEFTKAELREALLDNLRSCRQSSLTGPPGRIVPESLCQEIEEALALGSLMSDRSKLRH